VALGGCRAREAEAPLGTSDGRAALSVFVSIPPQAYSVARVGGERVTVGVLVRPGQSPATYEPTPTQMVALTEADVFFRIGVPFENGLMARLEASTPDLNVVDTRRGIDLRPMDADGHGDAHEAAKDPHIWLAPQLVIVQARTVCDELRRLDAAGAGEYEANLQALVADLEALDREIAETLAPLRGGEILVFHPSYGYFADAYGLKQVAVEVEGKEPSPRQLQAIISRARDRNVRVIFVQPEFATTSADAIAREIGATVVPLDPLARDYMANLRDMARRIRESLR